MVATPTTSRTPIVHNRFDLSVASREFIRVPVTSGKAVTVIASAELGTWSNRTLEVKQVSARSSFSFSTPKTIPAGGGRIQISSTEMQGVSEIEIVTSGGSADAAGTYATIAVTIEEGDGASDGQQVLTVADLPSMTSAQLAALITDEMGSGPAVFASHPSLTVFAYGSFS